MASLRFLWPTAWLARAARRNELGRLPSAAQMRRLLQRERARADRSGLPLALIAFSPPRPDTADETFGRLARYLARRLRSSDEHGWWTKWQLAAILPDTPGRGAWKVARDALQEFDDESRPRCTVYVYRHTGRRRAGRMRKSRLRRRVDPASASDMRHGNRAPGGLHLTPSNGVGNQGGDALRDPAAVLGIQLASRESVEPMALLFCRGLPWWKRLLDVAVAALGLILLLPLLALIALAVKATSRGPVFYREYRSGLGGAPFLIYKFRTMVRDAAGRQSQYRDRSDQDGPAFKLRRDPRVTFVGRWLRSTSLDELPQLWNVLRGEMSLVGPRPLPCREAEQCTPWQKRRLEVTPGMTCIWQVSGRCRVPFNEWMRMDLRYIRSRSPWADLKLLLATIPAVLSRRGAS